jgi:hypothetical protein
MGFVQRLARRPPALLPWSPSLLCPRTIPTQTHSCGLCAWWSAVWSGTVGQTNANRYERGWLMEQREPEQQRHEAHVVGRDLNSGGIGQRDVLA